MAARGRHGRGAATLRALMVDRRGVSAVEFAIVAMPFIMLLLGVFQMAIYYMTQSSLDAGVVQAGDSLVNTFYSGTTPSIPTAAALKALVVAKSGGMIRNDTTLSVELRQFSTLAVAPVAIGNTVDPSVPGNVLALRAQATVAGFVPGFTTLVVRSSSLVRRQAY